MTTTSPVMSRQYDSEQYRALPTDTIRWRTRPRTPRANCDECGALQYETRGASGRPQPARQCRSIVGAPDRDLLLCTEHAENWHARDDFDTEPVRHRRAASARGGR